MTTASGREQVSGKSLLDKPGKTVGPVVPAIFDASTARVDQPPEAPRTVRSPADFDLDFVKLHTHDIQNHSE
ncbi:MAG: hypothetical protein KDA74_01415 [Planctomycetaceae bacterium]|nr:hypothetical protein [Planctomycetaceae bacterium]